MERQCEGPQAEKKCQEAPQETPTPLVDAILDESTQEPPKPSLDLAWLKQAENPWDETLLDDEATFNLYGEKVEYTEEKVSLLRRATLVFFDRLNEKLRDNDIREFDLDDPDEDMTIDLRGEEVTVQWKEYGRCGDVDYFTKSMSLSELVDKEAA